MNNYYFIYRNSKLFNDLFKNLNIIHIESDFNKNKTPLTRLVLCRFPL